MTHTNQTARLFLSVGLLFLLPILTHAQVTISATDHIVEPDEDFTVQIKTSDFEGVIGCQFSVSWNPEVIRLKDAGNMNPALVSTIENFNIDSAITQGYIGFVWFHPAITAVTLEEDATLFELEFEVETDQAVTDTIKFGSVPTEIEVASESLETLDVVFESGIIQVDGMTDVIERRAAAAVELQATPNPFRESTTLQIDVKQAMEATLQVFSPQGSLVYTFPARTFAPGQQMVELPEYLFKQKGAYLVKIRSTDFVTTYKLIAQ